MVLDFNDVKVSCLLWFISMLIIDFSVVLGLLEIYVDSSGRRIIILLLDYKSILCEMKDHNLQEIYTPKYLFFHFF